MARSFFYVVTDDQLVAMRARQFAESCGAEARVFSQAEWNQKYGGNPESGVPSLSTGIDSVGPDNRSNVIQFPGNQGGGVAVSSHAVETINELESRAIENAIHIYKGNLTEAARALGIGRATLYRKVKQYNIDPQVARRKKVA